MATHYFEDDWRKAAQKMEVGDRLTTKSRIISRTDVELFALLGGDVIPQFLSDSHAQEAGWKSQLVPGLCTLNIGYGLLIQSGFIADVIAYMGTKNMEFRLPVYVGDSVRMETEVASKKLTKKGWICEYDWTIVNQDGEAVGMGHNT